MKEPSNESSPLVVEPGASQEAFSLVECAHHGNATATQTFINLAKTCFGTGALALPFAAQQGGIVLYIFGTMLIAIWNVYTMQRLCGCFDILVAPHQHPDPISKPPIGTSTLGKVAWYALGPRGLLFIDSMMVCLLLAINVAYLDAIRSFLASTAFTTGSAVIDSSIVASIMASLSVVPDMGYLTKASATGLAVLLFAFAVIAGYGIVNVGNSERYKSYLDVVGWLPRGLGGVSSWFGCSCFGFGVVPLTFNFRDSMAQPKRLVPTTAAALLSVASVYVLIGLILSMWYPFVLGDILHELPEQGALPALTRVSMAAMVIVTAPLLIVPCGELLEGKLKQISARSNELDSSSSWWATVTVRFCICAVAVIISVTVPNFVRVLSFVGSFCVATMSFVVPLLLHILLQYNHGQQQDTRRDLASVLMANWLDFILLLWGIFVTIFTTLYTFRNSS